MPIDLSSVNPNLLIILPPGVLAVFALVVLVLDLYSQEKRWLAGLSLVGVLLSLVALWFASRPGAVPPGDYFGRMVTADHFTFYMVAVLLVAAGLVILFSMDWVPRRLPKVQVEYYELVLFATLGMMFMAASRDVTLIYLGLELSSQASYILAGLLRNDPRSNEAALKYFLNGALASAVLLFGLSILYGLTGTTYLPEMLVALGQAPLPLLVTAMVFVIAGFGFKVAAAPFHLWAPDAYEGAPTPVSGFFSMAPKAAAWAAVLRVFLEGLSIPQVMDKWSVLYAVLSASSMLIGNLTALWQTNVKRMMAYSSVSHAGYILVGVAAAARAPEVGAGAVLFYLLSYILTNAGIWAALVALENQGEGTEMADFRGLAQRNPALAWSLLLLFVSLIGIPPTVGFFGKFFLFRAGVQAGYVWLAVLMAINSAISVGYYYAVVRNMFFEKTEKPRLELGSSLQAVVALSVLAVLVVGLGSSPVIQYAEAALGLLGR
ncbi:MAG: NADH-quinone oxidoreductase subunit N [Firmicutes bacterium]|nr:NADH-quinone oxidoreductase subunit N [Bacillota bacterium]